MGGRVALSIAWPARNSRYIPPYANSISLTLYSEGNLTSPISLTVNRPADLPLVQQVQFNGPIPADNYTLKGLALTGKDGGGQVVASADAELVVEASGTTNVPMTLASTLYSITLNDMPLSLHVGDVKDLSVTVLDQDHQIIFLNNTDLSWSMVFGADKSSVDSQGIVNGLAEGQARVHVEELGAGIYAEGDINVTSAGSINKKPTIRHALRRR